MRRGILCCLLLLTVLGIGWLIEKGQGQAPASDGDALAQKELMVNGTFTDGIRGWQLNTTSAKPDYQVVQIEGISEHVLALAADHQGVSQLSQLVRTETPFVRLQYKANFLSTRGDGRIEVTALGESNQPLATLGWVAAGDMPPWTGNVKWYDLRVPLNTLGNWLEQDILLAERFAQEFPQLDTQKISGYQINLIVSHGQHGVFSDVHLWEQSRAALRLQVIHDAGQRSMGDEFVLPVQITNTGKNSQQAVVVQALEPYGWGLVVKEPVQKIDVLGPGETKVINWVVTAQRPSTVNFGNPWELVFQVAGGAQQAKTVVAVADPRPGKIYYVLTDDLEPMDAAGYAAAYGNQNAWLDPEEFNVQLVQKAERLNAIADTYGAKWSHYIAWTAVTGAEWAAAQSKTGAWPTVIEAIKQSVQHQSASGHEYAIHMHSDYDPRFPQAILQYNADTDGFWANHQRHGWAHNLPELGVPDDITSRTGSLYYYHARLTELMRQSGQGQIIATRVGSFDFGDVSAEQSKSMEAYRRVGLMAGSDADGNRGGAAGADFTKSLYLTSADDINKPARDLQHIGLLQFRPNPVHNIAYDVDNAEILNQKVADGVAAYVQQGKVIAGVHAIVGFTHAMFIMGGGDWRSLEGGQFAQIERHLHYVQQNFSNPGLLHFATSSELAKEYWDYYTPKLMAVYGSEQQQGRGTFVYPIRLLGSQIPVDTGHIHNVTMKYPLYLRDKAYKIEVRKNGQVIMKTWGLPTPYNDIVFSVDDRTATYTMHIYADEMTGRIVRMLRWVWQKMQH